MMGLLLGALQAKENIRMRYCGYFVTLPDLRLSKDPGLFSLGPCWHGKQTPGI